MQNFQPLGLRRFQQKAQVVTPDTVYWERLAVSLQCTSTYKMRTKESLFCYLFTCQPETGAAQGTHNYRLYRLQSK